MCFRHLFQLKAFCVLRYRPAGVLALAVPSEILRLDAFLQRNQRFGVKDIADNLGAGLAVRREQLHKFSLRNHGNLLKRTAVHAEQVLHRFGHGGCARDRRTVRIGQHRIGLLGDRACTAFFWPLVFGCPMNLIDLSAV